MDHDSHEPSDPPERRRVNDAPGAREGMPANGASDGIAAPAGSGRTRHEDWTTRGTAAVDSNLLRQLNRSRIFHSLRIRPGSSQKELAEVTGLTSGTVSNVVRELRREGLVRENRRQRPAGGHGRPAKSLHIAKDAGMFAGVQFDMQYLTLVVTTLDGVPVDSRQLASATDVGEAVETAVSGLREMIAGAGRAVRDLRGLGVGVAGLVDHGYLMAAPYQSWVWRDVDLAELFRARIGCPVYVDNDAKAAALGERMFGAGRELDTFVVLACYAGLGSGLYLQGSVFGGRNSMAGEIGHIKVVADGRRCGCGGHGCLSAYASASSILRILRERGVEVASVDDAAALAASRDATTLGVLHEAARHLGHVLAVLVTTVSPEAVIIGGELTKLMPYLMPEIQRVVRAETLEQNWLDDLLGTSSLGGMQVPLGGVALAMEGFLGLPRWMSVGRTHPSL